MNPPQDKNNFKMNFIFFVAILVFGIILISAYCYYFVWTEKITTIERKDFGYCDNTILEYPKNANILCSKGNMVQEYYDIKKIYACLNMGEATCLIEQTKREWRK